MPQRLHFISGLPRSGSTLLSALLRQNPRFSTSITSPVFLLCTTLLEKMGGAIEFAPFLNENRRATVMRGVVHAYYSELPSKSVVFDTNRLWTGQATLVRSLFPDARIICCVRDVGWILDSIERMLRLNPLQTSRIFNYKLTGSVYERAEILMNSKTGLVGLPWSTLREAWFGDTNGQLLLVDYDRLVSQPRVVLARLYESLGEEPFTHDFDNVSHDEVAYDATLGMPGMHTVRGKVAAAKRETCLPPDIFARYSDTSFWRREDSSDRKIRIL